jgi:DNA-binding NarL/FixJ family response regulator
MDLLVTLRVKPELAAVVNAPAPPFPVLKGGEFGVAVIRGPGHTVSDATTGAAPVARGSPSGPFHKQQLFQNGKMLGEGMNGAAQTLDGALGVVVVDDEQLVRAGLRMILNCAPGLDVLATCDGPEALAAVDRHQPDIVLLDIEMPGTDGIAVLRRIQALPKPPTVAMLTTFDTESYVRAALEHGAAGYFVKDTDPDQLIQEVHALASGGRPLAPGVTRTVIDGYLAGSHPSPPDETTARVAALTPREREALLLLGCGLTNAEIAGHMNIAPSTAKDHVSTLLAKIGRLNRVQAAVWAARAGLLPRWNGQQQRADRPRTTGQPAAGATR